MTAAEKFYNSRATRRNVPNHTPEVKLSAKAKKAPDFRITWMRLFNEPMKNAMGFCGVVFPVATHKVNVTVDGASVERTMVQSAEFKFTIKRYGDKGVGMEATRGYRVNRSGQRSLENRAPAAFRTIFVDVDGQVDSAAQKAYFQDVLIPAYHEELSAALRDIIMNDQFKEQERPMALYLAHELEAMTREELRQKATQWNVTSKDMPWV